MAPTFRLLVPLRTRLRGMMEARDERQCRSASAGCGRVCPRVIRPRSRGIFGRGALPRAVRDGSAVHAGLEGARRGPRGAVVGLAHGGVRGCPAARASRRADRGCSHALKRSLGRLRHVRVGRGAELIEPRPSMVVASGSRQHLHAYWFLQEPVELDRLEHLNRRLGSAWRRRWSRHQTAHDSQTCGLRQQEALAARPGAPDRPAGGPPR